MNYNPLLDCFTWLDCFLKCLENFDCLHHPDGLEYWVEQGKMTREEMNAIIKKCEKIANFCKEYCEKVKP